MVEKKDQKDKADRGNKEKAEKRHIRNKRVVKKFQKKSSFHQHDSSWREAPNPNKFQRFTPPPDTKKARQKYAGLKQSYQVLLQVKRVADSVPDHQKTEEDEEKQNKNVGVEAAFEVKKGLVGSYRAAKQITSIVHLSQNKKDVTVKKCRHYNGQNSAFQNSAFRNAGTAKSGFKNGEHPIPRSKQTRKQKIKRQKIKKQYSKAAYRTQQKASAATPVIRRILEKVASRKEAALIMAGIAVFLLFIIGISSAMGMVFTQTFGAALTGCYLSTDDAIEQADLYYTQLEMDLQDVINETEKAKPGYDEYRYNIGTIEHDPFVLISYLSAKYEEFDFDTQVKAELESLFAKQYGLLYEKSVEHRSEKKIVSAGASLGKVMTSAYCSCRICCGIWAGGPTASGVMPKANHTLAVDAKNPFVPMGTKIIMNGIEYTVEDTGNFASFGAQFDVYYDKHSLAQAHGHKQYEAYLADGNETKVEVTVETDVTILNTTLKTQSLAEIVKNRLNADQRAQYDVYMETKGLLQCIGTPVDYNWRNVISSYYGYRKNQSNSTREMHQGIDLAVPEGTPVKAGMDALVSEVGTNSSQGNYIVLTNERGYAVRYTHLSSLTVSRGQTAGIGTVIGATGTAGGSGGSRLHVEVMYQGKYLNPVFYLDTGAVELPGGGANDETFRRLINEAEKYLGYPYVWGGSNPSTSFDCSGFVCWVFTNSGVYNLPRTTAQGIYEQCEPISADKAKPGDIIFFQGTYETNGASHLGIYVGDGQMIHCGDPIQYASIYSPYWQSHFMGFGRLLK